MATNFLCSCVGFFCEEAALPQKFIFFAYYDLI